MGSYTTRPPLTVNFGVHLGLWSAVITHCPFTLHHLTISPHLGPWLPSTHTSASRPLPLVATVLQHSAHCARVRIPISPVRHSRGRRDVRTSTHGLCAAPSNWGLALHLSLPNAPSSPFFARVCRVFSQLLGVQRTAAAPGSPAEDVVPLVVCADRGSEVVSSPVILGQERRDVL